MPSELPQPISRRQLLRLLTTSSGGLAVAAFVPGQWVKPLVEVGYLPAHAQGSNVSATSTPRPTNTNSPNTPTSTSTPTGTSNPSTSTPTNTPQTPTPTGTNNPSTPTSTATGTVTTPFTLSNLRRTLTNLNGCTGPDGSIGSLFEVKFDYQNSNAGVTTAAKIAQQTRFSPSNREAIFNVTNFTITGTASTGTITYTVCTGFGSDTQVTTQVTVTDINGVVSNTLSATFDKPVGASDISPTSYEMP